MSDNETHNNSDDTPQPDSPEEKKEKKNNDEEGDYAPVPTDKASDFILVSFFLWTLLVIPIYWFTSRVERHPVPEMNSVVNRVKKIPTERNAYHFECGCSHNGMFVEFVLFFVSFVYKDSNIPN